MNIEEFTLLVKEERRRQDGKHGTERDLPDSPTGEEFREACDASEEAARASCERATEEGRLTYSHILEEETAEVFAAAACGNTRALRIELIQAAAVCLKWLEAIDRRTLVGVVDGT